jgi:entericidin A
MKTIVIVLAAAFVSAGCNTVHGLGQDVQKLGEKLEQKSSR